ncbi:DUF3551 domain-containing protein [Bradyrhizobium diazoefficiens]|nr:DUF3551 domain-containing protein [Bradyrhizobium diazoefficiens]MBR0851555.1 DUF3551 domain-containing protein [Bradyrhizobium diazoefficiens]
MKHRLLATAVLLGAVASLGASTSAVAQDRYCLQGRIWGYPGNCQFATYQQCMATASGTNAYCGINPQYAFAAQRRGRGYR